MFISRFLKNTRGFTVTELLLVTSLLSSIPVSGYVVVKNKALQIECLSNLRMIGTAVECFVADNDAYPNAKFYPEEPLKDMRSIVKIMKPYGLQGNIFTCRSSPPALMSKGLSYLWNDELSGKNPAQVRDPAATWMMTDVTALDERISSHSGGYNILYADGHQAWSSAPPLSARKK